MFIATLNQWQVFIFTRSWYFLP